MSDEWTYIGDGLYARYDGYCITLRANDPQNADSPTVYLEYAVYMQLVEFASRSNVFDLEWSSDERT